MPIKNCASIKCSKKVKDHLIKRKGEKTWDDYLNHLINLDDKNSKHKSKRRKTTEGSSPEKEEITVLHEGDIGKKIELEGIPPVFIPWGEGGYDYLKVQGNDFVCTTTT